MMGWVARVLARVTLARRPLVALSSTATELQATKKHHDATIKKADSLLEDFRRFDGALRIMRPKQ
jgi:hypothetical protein